MHEQLEQIRVALHQMAPEARGQRVGEGVPKRWKIQS